MSENSGSGGAWSGLDSVPRDVVATDGDSCRRAWDSDLPPAGATHADEDDA